MIGTTSEDVGSVSAIIDCINTIANNRVTLRVTFSPLSGLRQKPNIPE